MNRADVEMLNRQLDELGNSFLRQHALKEQKQSAAEELDLKRKQLDVDQTFRQEQLQRLKNMEQNQTAANAQKVDAATVQTKQKMLQSVLHANSTGALDDDAIAEINDWLASDPVFSSTGMQIQKPPGAKPGKDAAVVNAVKTAQEFRASAKNEQDPEKIKELNDNADRLEKWVEKSSNFKPAEGYVTTTVKPTIDMAGKQVGSSTNTTTRLPLATAPAKAPFTLPGAAPAAPAPVGTGTIVPPAHINFLKANPTGKVISDFEAKYGAGSAQQYLKQ